MLVRLSSNVVELHSEQVLTSPASYPDISEMTGMTADDIVLALDFAGFLHKHDDGSFSIDYDASVLQAYLERFASKNLARVNATKLRWTPHVFQPMGRVIEPPTEPTTDAPDPDDDGNHDEGEAGEEGEGPAEEKGKDEDGKDDAAAADVEMEDA